MKTSSCKAKGRRCSAAVKEKLLAHAPDLEPDDVIVTPSGVTGPDVFLSPKAQQEYPFVIECKNQETAKIWAWIEQTQSHVPEGSGKIPVLFFKRNNSDIHACLLADDFLDLVKGHHTVVEEDEEDGSQ